MTDSKREVAPASPDNGLDRLYEHTQVLLRDHERLLADAVRNRLFQRALKEVIMPGARVVDIGAGTGIWSVAAALCGASKVVAIEREPLLVGPIRDLARENGVADRVEVHVGDSRRLALDREFDVVVSETIGSLAFDEDVVPILMDARARFLKPGGILVPESVALVAAPARLARPYRRLPAGVAVRGGSVEWLALNAPASVGAPDRLRLLDKPRTLLRAELSSVGELPDLSRLRASWALRNARRLNCVAVWTEATLSPSVSLSTRDTSSWSPLAYRVERFRRDEGRLDLELDLSAAPRWSVSLVAGLDIETQQFAPAQASTILLAGSRSDVSLLDHFRRTRPPRV